MSLLARQKEFVGYLTEGFPDLGLKPICFDGGCATTGNYSVENKVLPTTDGRKDHGSDGSGQWRLDRLNGEHGLKGWAATHKLPWDTLRTQAAFTLWELEQDYRFSRKHGEPALLPILQSGIVPDQFKNGVETNLDALTRWFCDIYERPDPKYANIPLRQRHARSIQMIMQQEAVPPVLQNAVNGPWSTLFGILCGLVSWFKFDTVDSENWLLWGAMGVLAIFFIGGKQPPVEPVEDVPPPVQEPTKMDLTVIPKILAIVEALGPILEKVLADIPQIKADIEHIKATIAQQNAAPDATTTDALARVQAMVEQLSTKLQG